MSACETPQEATRREARRHSRLLCDTTARGARGAQTPRAAFKPHGGFVLFGTFI